MGDWKCCKLVVMSDASFANMNDGVSSCGGHIVLLVGQDQNCCTLAWRSCKIKRVVKSTLAAEMLSLAEGLEHGLYLQHVVEEVVGLRIPLEAIVDNKSAVDALHSTKSVEDKRLRIDVGIVKEMMTSGQVKDVKWVPGSSMIADVLTKRGVAPFVILELIQRGKFDM